MINRNFTSDDKEVLIEALNLLVEKEQDEFDRTKLFEKLRSLN